MVHTWLCQMVSPQLVCKSTPKIPQMLASCWSIFVTFGHTFPVTYSGFIGGVFGLSEVVGG